MPGAQGAQQEHVGVAEWKYTADGKARGILRKDGEKEWTVEGVCPRCGEQDAEAIERVFNGTWFWEWGGNEYRCRCGQYCLVFIYDRHNRRAKIMGAGQPRFVPINVAPL